MIGRINKTKSEIVEENKTSEEIIENMDKSEYDGLTVLKNVFTQSELRKALNNQDIKEFERVNLFDKMNDSAFHKLLKNGSIKKAVSNLLKTTDFHITTFSSHTLFPNVDKRAYHVDWPYHQYTKEFLEKRENEVEKRKNEVEIRENEVEKRENEVDLIYSERLVGVQVIIPLDNFTEENGATMYVPYSNLARRYPSVELLKSGYFTAAFDEDDSEERRERKKSQKFVCKKRFMTGNVGDVFVYPSTLWHSQGLNVTTEKRRALLINFSPKDIPVKNC